MWTWDQSAGTMTRGPTTYKGYSGHEWGVNNPSADAAPNIGPLPRGTYKMTELRETGASTGPYTIVLQQVSGDSHGRSAFRIHGDSLAHPGEASHGCIILGRPFREAMWCSGDHDLTVIA